MYRTKHPPAESGFKTKDKTARLGLLHLHTNPPPALIGVGVFVRSKNWIKKVFMQASIAFMYRVGKETYRFNI